MLSYKHAFHAGNHADMLKHLSLCLLLRQLNRKDKPYSIIDTHAGSGLYDLDCAMSAQNREYASGIEKIEQNPKLRQLVPEFYQVLDSLREQKTRAYPGSPYFCAKLSREQDRLTFIDLHPAEFENLRNNFKRDRRCSIQCRDGLDALNVILPPTPRRGLIFIDPAYEDKNDYALLIKNLRHGIKRFENGIFAIWYPVLGKLRDHSKNLTQEVKRLGYPLLQAELRVAAQEEEFGMCGSGMLIVNYPFELDLMLTKVMEELYLSLCDKNGSAKLKIVTPHP